MTRYDYIKKCIDVFLDIECPIQYIKDWFEVEDVNLEYCLQDYVVDNLKNEFQFLTGIGVIESAIHNVNEAYSNNNIKY